ncbi:ketopantoate reductase family protein [Streptomyces sp. NBC_00448]|uniref:ketopantoate reductase family protein n=1 Tax=Streptomyces sp. NBC_00448 TaxID=2903652 RepID=UPI002E1A1BE9
MSGDAAGPGPAPVRYVVIGAGAVGVTLAAGLHRTGADVLLVARGRQLAALRSGRLRLVRPDGAAADASSHAVAVAVAEPESDADVAPERVGPEGGLR